MGLVFQDEALFTGLSIYDNTSYRLAEHGWSEEDTERAVGEVLRFVGLETEADKFPHELSGGMRRRVEFARAHRCRAPCRSTAPNRCGAALRNYSVEMN